MKIAQVWLFLSESSPDKKYETMQYEDGSTSCNCKGWTFKKKSAGGMRSCRHTRLVEMGMADESCLSTKQYIEREMPVVQVTTQVEASLTLGGKRFIVTD
jgi:hypothetical protein